MPGRPENDREIADIAEYTHGYDRLTDEAYRIARYAVMDSLGCALEALRFPDCARMLGPIVPGTFVPNGARVPGTSYELDPVTAAFDLGTMIRWIDCNDSLGFAGGAHPSDNLGAVLAVADHLSRKRLAAGEAPLTMRDALAALIKSYEIQGGLSRANSVQDFGFDYPVFSRVAAAAVVTGMLGGGREEIANAVSNAFADGVTLNIYRRGNNTGPRKSWAGGDACARGVQLALMAMAGGMGYPSVLSAKKYGFYDAIYRGKPFAFPRPYESSVMEGAIFKSVPAGMASQTAAECAFRLHPLVKNRIDEIESIAITTHRKVMVIMDKNGPLTNFADRDHCVQYVLAVALIHGKLDASDYQDDFAADPRIDILRAKMVVAEDPLYTQDYRERHTDTNAIRVRFKDGSSLPEAKIEYPFGHPKRREEGLTMVEAKFRRYLARHFDEERQTKILGMFADKARFEAVPVNEFVGWFVA